MLWLEYGVPLRVHRPKVSLQRAWIKKQKRNYFEWLLVVGGGGGVCVFVRARARVFGGGGGQQSTRGGHMLSRVMPSLPVKSVTFVT